MKPRIALVGIAAAGLIVLAGAPAFGAGSGYVPTTPPGKAGSAGFSSIVTAQTVPSSGGTVTGSANGATCSVTVPAGAFPNGAIIVISAGAPSSINAGSGNTVVTDFSIVALDPNSGALLSGPFGAALTVTISASGITSSSTVVNVTAPGVTSAVNAQVSQGQAVVSVTADPNLAVLQGHSTTGSVTSATSGQLAFTGVGPGIGLLGLLGLGATLLGLAAFGWLRVRAAR